MPALHVIDDSTPDRDLFPADFGRGLDLSNRPAGFAYGGTAEPFPDNMLIPRSDWQGMIEEREARKATLRAAVDRAGLPCKDQARTNYCWANAPTHCIEVDRVRQGQETVILSAASVAAPLVNYRNVGGFGKDALQSIADKGVVPESLWPVNAIDPKYHTPAAAEAAKAFRATEWWELEPGNLDHLISALLWGLPVAIGLSWWSHEVTSYDPIWLDGAIATRNRNSWTMAYGDKGYFNLQGKRMLPDDAVCPRVVVA